MFGIDVKGAVNTFLGLPGATIGVIGNWLKKPIEERILRWGYGLIVQYLEATTTFARQGWLDVPALAWRNAADLLDVAYDEAWRVGGSVVDQFTTFSYKSIETLFAISDNIVNRAGSIFGPIFHALGDGLQWVSGRVTSLEWWRDFLWDAFGGLKWVFDSFVTPAINELLGFRDWVSWLWGNVLEPTLHWLGDVVVTLAHQVEVAFSQLHILDAFRVAAEFILGQIAGQVRFLLDALAPILAFGSIFDFILSLADEMLDEMNKELARGLDELFPDSAHWRDNV